MCADHTGSTSSDVPARRIIADYLDATTRAPEHADLIFLPGTRLPDPARIAAKLLATDVAPLALVTGGINKVTGANEGLALRSAILSCGVSPDRILVENASTNTLENVVKGWEVVAARHEGVPLKTVVAVCKWMHSRRVLMTLKAHFPAGVRYYACTYAPEGVTRDDWIRYGNVSSQTSGVTANWRNIPAYLAKGDIQEIARTANGGWV